MEVILLEKVHKLGTLGEKVNVKSGYGRNYLIPNGKALPATPENLEEFEQRRAELERIQGETLASAQARADKLADLVVTIEAKAGSEGKLFGSVGTADIAKAIVDAGIEVEKQEVRLPDGAFRELGDYPVELHLHADVDATVSVRVVAEP